MVGPAGMKYNLPAGFLLLKEGQTMNEEWIFVGEFAAKVVDYIRMEWQVELHQFSQKHQDAAFKLVADLKGKQNVPNIAATIANEVLPL